MYHVGYHKGHRPSSIREPPVEPATSITVPHLCEAPKEAVWLNKLVQSVATQGLRTVISGGPINIKVDNSGCIDFSKNPVEHKRTKHIDIRYNFVREAITTDKVTLEHCATDDMVADPMTKELGKTKHETHDEAMGLC